LKEESMSAPAPARVLTAAIAFLFCITSSADAQISRLKKAATDAAERETANQVDRLVAEAVACAFDDPRCIEEAEKSGQPVVMTDHDGNVITNDAGEPVSDPKEAEEIAGTDGPAGRPGEGVWANYDFVPGERILFAEHFEKDRVGDWPRRLEFVNGNAEIVEWEGGRFLRANDDTEFEIFLPEALPERFTMEFDLNLGAVHLGTFVFTEVMDARKMSTSQYPGNYFVFDANPGVAGAGRESRTQTHRIRDQLTAVRIHVDGKYAKVYLNEQRISNIPNAELPRGDRIRFRVSANQNYPTYLGNIQIAAGGGDLYDALSTEGRVATRGILFDFNSDRLRAESTPTLSEIGEMLQDHTDMSLLIEGHTDSEGDDSYNQELSHRRAQSVVAHLVAEYGIAPERLASEGFGETRPQADNATPEGRQQNRRVELVVR
jgi:outer membrane protein OmpA-like peptidoglycan-associated protein